MFLSILFAIIIILFLCLLLDIKLILKVNLQNKSYRGFVKIIVLRVLKVTRSFDDELKFEMKKSDEEEKEKQEKEEKGENYFVEFMDKYVDNKDIDFKKVTTLYYGVLDIFNIAKDKININVIKLKVDYAFEDAAATSLSYGLFSGVLGMFVSFCENKKLVRDDLRVSVMPHFSNSSFISSDVDCIFSIKLGNIIITGLKIIIYLRRVKKKLKKAER